MLFTGIPSQSLRVKNISSKIQKILFLDGSKKRKLQNFQQDIF